MMVFIISIALLLMAFHLSMQKRGFLTAFVIAGIPLLVRVTDTAIAGNLTNFRDIVALFYGFSVIYITLRRP